MLFITLSAFLDIFANLLLKKSNGFECKMYGVVAIILAILAFFLLSISLKSIPLAIAYSLWGAIGIIGTCAGGAIFFGEKLNFIGILGVILVVLAVCLLNYA